MTEAVLFDLDGTLVNSISDIGNAMNHALAELGQPGFAIRQYYQMVGGGMKNLCRRALAEDKGHLQEALLQRYQARYLACCCEQTAVYPGAPQLLEGLRHRGLKLAVITNKPQDQARRVVDALLPGAPLAVVWGQQPPFAVKPDPAVYHHVCGLLGVRAESTLYCGDSDVDILFAHRAGARAAGCLWGFRGREELEKAGADFLAGQPLEILSIAGG